VRSGSDFRMYYTGIAGCCGSAIGLATSTDGIHWTKDAGNPVLAPSATGWDSLYVSTPQVDFDGSTWTMYYEGGGATSSQIGIATSSDGHTWTKAAANPILTVGAPGHWDSGLVSPGGVVTANGIRYMMYTGRTPTGPQSVGLATSIGGGPWHKFGDAPVLGGGGIASWDWTIRAGTARLAGNTIQLWYSGNPSAGAQWSMGYATSSLAVNVSVDRPAQFQLAQNAPNPFRGVTRIGFELADDTPVSLQIFDMQGRLVATLADGSLGVGPHTADFHAADHHAASGVYLCRLTAGSHTECRKMFLLQ
jgi:hypothetical protein